MAKKRTRAGNTRTFTVSFPIELGDEVVRMAQGEGRTISEFFRESFRKYRTHQIREALMTMKMKAEAHGDDRFGLEEDERLDRERTEKRRKKR